MKAKVFNIVPFSEENIQKPFFYHPKIEKSCILIANESDETDDPKGSKNSTAKGVETFLFKNENGSDSNKETY